MPFTQAHDVSGKPSRSARPTNSSKRSLPTKTLLRSTGCLPAAKRTSMGTSVVCPTRSRLTGREGDEFCTTPPLPLSVLLLRLSPGLTAFVNVSRRVSRLSSRVRMSCASRLLILLRPVAIMIPPTITAIGITTTATTLRKKVMPASTRDTSNSLPGSVDRTTGRWTADTLGSRRWTALVLCRCDPVRRQSIP